MMTALLREARIVMLVGEVGAAMQHSAGRRQDLGRRRINGTGPNGGCKN
jgi:hypothetical protein